MAPTPNALGSAAAAAAAPITSAATSLLPSGFFSGALWLRVAEVIIGGALILVGIGAMIRKPLESAAGPVGKVAKVIA